MIFRSKKSSDIIKIVLEMLLNRKNYVYYIQLILF